MISTRGRTSASWIDQSMAKRCARGANACPSPGCPMPACSGSNTTRMKKRPLSTSPYWLLSSMLQPCSARNVPTAPTMPGRSAQDSVRMYREGGMRARPARPARRAAHYTEPALPRLPVEPVGAPALRVDLDRDARHGKPRQLDVESADDERDAAR